jgi:steroid delta-isomerase-like uncharacterized protein
MNRHELQQIALQWIEQGWQGGETGVVDRLHSQDFIDHDPGGRSPDRAGFKQGIATLFEAFPDFRAVIEDLVVDEARQSVAVRWSATGTHRDTYLGFGATGRTIRFKGIEIIRIRDGRIVERWGEWDGLDLREQMGAGGPPSE